MYGGSTCQPLKATSKAYSKHILAGSRLLPTDKGACRFVPVVAAVLQLRLFSQLLEAVLLHAQTKQIKHAWLMTVATNSSKMLGSIDILVRELTEVTLICFV